ncbi:hypothetical protein IQ266_21620 [filamentous cyanobacterium LEGE 11480]|uniref:DUF7925 domain-containing protein n=1 Tax=Romeriopsis navalis LEGE 11480 TaxID=2777977 RepID=A0A928VPY4_9CYAN|nr:hypothetical protein [Romeriopsis navalis]MBE9032340.1 hypothetical protein [Romeriopsis navalis LEGE 11480]
MTFRRNRWSYRQWLVALLLASGSMSIALPLMAQTQIGDQIKNTFTGTFQDNNGQEFTATSNEVVLQVSEVAGLTVQAQAPSKANPDPDDNITVDFVITNVGNDPTFVFIPGQATIADPPSQSGSGSFTQGTLQIVEFNGTTLTTPVNIPTNGLSSESFPANALPNGGALNAGQTIKVRVPLAVASTALKNDSVIVSLGNTGGTADQQNIGFTNDAGSVFTNNIPDGNATGEAAGNPVNGQREAMDTSQVITVGARLQSFATILLARDYQNGNTPGDVSDDRITYNLAARIERDLPTGITDVVPTALCQTEVTLEGLNVNRVLVSDAIPADTVLSSANPIAPVDGTWDVVYTTSALTIPANQANWTATRPTDSSTITRVGYLRDTCIPTNSTVTGFSFTVEPVTGFNGGRIVNIAQIFGQSTPGTPVTDTATQIVYDESGDQDPNNGLGLANPDPATGGVTENNGGIMARRADLDLDGTDPGNGTSPIANDTNQGVNTGSTAGTKPAGGETVAQTIASAPANGPDTQPGAIGPNNTDDDFTNVILAPPAAIPANQQLDDAQTPPTVFNNTVQSFSSIPQVISLLPQPPASPEALPDGTIVTITNPANGQTATYTYSSANGFTFVSGQGGPTATLPVTLPIDPNVSNTGSYTVTVDLPNAEQATEYPIPIIAFIDQGAPGFDAGDPGNITIDRIYTGYIQVIKEARVLEDDGTTEIVPFTTDTSQLTDAAQTGRFVEYRLTYTNISTAQGNGTNNIVLPATDFSIVDDGAAAPNNWFVSTQDPSFPAQATGTATSSSGTISVTTTNGDIQAYQLTVPSLNPGETGTFTFRRQISEQ